MKKFFLIAAAAAMVLSSCSKNTVTEDSTTGNLIGFGVYSGRTLTKADGTFIPAGQTYLPANQSFGVYCYSSTADNFQTAIAGGAKPNFMANQLVKYTLSSTEDPSTFANDKSKYVYSPTKYWPKKINGTYVLNLSFYAYYPYTDAATPTDGITSKPTSETAASATSGLGAFNYVVPATADKQPDFMVSEVLADQNYDSHTGNVPIIFHHVLSQLKVTARVDKDTYDNATVTITNIVFNNLDNKGTLTPNYIEDPHNPGHYITTYTWTDKGINTGVSNDYTVTPESGIVLDNSVAGKNCTSGKNTILTVPQTFPDDATIDITYTVEGNGGTTKSYTVTVPIKNVVTETGKCTNFDFTISLFDSTKPITFTASVVEWTNTTVNKNA